MQKPYALARMYRHLNRHADAVALWTRVVTRQEPSTEADGSLEELARYLGSLSDRALLTTYAPVLLKADATVAAKVRACLHLRLLLLWRLRRGSGPRRFFVCRCSRRCRQRC